MKGLAYLSLVATLLLSPCSLSAQRNERNEGGVLSQGTNVRVRIPDNLNSDRDREGDQFEVILDQDLVSSGRVLVRAGSAAFLRLVDVRAGGA